MYTKMLRKLTLFTLLFLVVACRQTESGDEPQATVLVSLNTDSLLVVSSKVLTAPTDFSLRLENTRGENLKEWSSIDDVPSEVRMVAGSYRFVAYNGKSDVFPSWDQLYWQGENKFKVNAAERIETPIVVKLGVTKVVVTFDASFEKYYSAYSADVRTTTPKTPDAGFLTYTLADQGKEGMFLPGTLRFRVNMTNKLDGKDYQYSPPSAVGAAKAAEQHNLHLKITQTSGYAQLVVIYDDNVKEVIDLRNLPSSILPKAAPRLRSVGFDYTQDIVTYSQGIAPSEKLSAAIEALAGVRSLKILATSEAMREALGGQSAVEIVGVNSENRYLLNAAGFTWSEVLSKPETAQKATSRIEVRFDDMFAKLKARLEDADQGTDYRFEIQVEDALAQKSEMTSKFEVKTKITPPIFSMVAPTQANVWANKAEFDLSYTANVEGAEPYIEIRQAGQSDWVRATDQDYLVLGEGRHYQTVRGLQSQSEYSFRARFGEFTLDEYTFTTETPQTVANGDMESWKAWFLDTKHHNVPYYRPYADAQTPYWTTNNDRTTSYRTSGIFGTTYGYNCFPAVSYSLVANGGKYAAEVRTTSASDINALNTTDITQKHSQVAGLLYIGDFSYSKPNDNVTQGKPFASRPTSMSFYHTYTEYNNDSFDATIILWSGVTEIGRGVYTGKEQTSYTQVTVPVVYSNRLLKADKMSIMFRSTTKSQPEVLKITMDLDFEADPDYNKGWSVFVGSVLRVDDISLNY